MKFRTLAGVRMYQFGEPMATTSYLPNFLGSMFLIKETSQEMTDFMPLYMASAY